jgi:glycosyltransferase involved in cell wall biosynthesis
VKTNVASALNLGIRSARGRYVCCLAADDTVEPTYFEKLLSLLESNPGVAIAYSLVKTFGDEDAIWFTEAFDLRLLLEYNYVCAAAVFRKAIWEVVNGFDQSMDGYEDWDFWIKVGKAGFRGKLIPEALFNYRRHGTTLNRRSDRDYQNLIDHIRTNHKDLYTHLDQITEIQSNYRDIKVPEPFINLSSKAQYLHSSQSEVVLLVSASNNQDADLFFQDIASKLVGKQAVNFVLVRTRQFSYERRIPQNHRSNHNYCLEQFLDPYCWLDFVLNVINTRSVKSVVISNSAFTYEWMAALKNRTSSFVTNVIQDDEFLNVSSNCDEFIDLHIVLSEHAVKLLTRDLGVSPRKIRSLSTMQQTNIANDL